MNYHYQQNLPIYQKRHEIIDSIRSNQVTIISGETGSGKTTQLPLLCLDAGRGVNGKKIGCTQPRRIAAISLASFVGSSFDDPMSVGYKIRFREHLNRDAKIKFMTDGILLAETAGDFQLGQYDTIIIDEAHERSINIDFLLGYMRWLLPARPDLRLIISSATIDTKLFSRCFRNAPVIAVSGRLFPVEIRYKPLIALWKGESMDSCIEGVAASVEEIINSGEQGDILIFLPTIDDIYETVNRLRYYTEREQCSLHPLHSRMSAAAQQSIFRRSNTRKIVVATNIAETSITVPGVRFVIDTGLARVLRYEPSVGFSRMPIEQISRASADQRTGRCGRVREGICIRLYSEQDYLSRPPFTTPELRRANLSGVILRMLRLGLGDAGRFPFPQNPSHKSICDGYRQLRELDAIDRKNRLTPLGKKMALLPLDPPLSRMLMYAGEHGAARELLILASALSVDDPMCFNHEENTSKGARSFRHPDSDFMSYINLWTALNGSLSKQYLPVSALKKFCTDNGLLMLHMREWRDVYDQLKRICKSIPGFFDKAAIKNSYDTIHKSLLFGLKNGVSCRVDNGLYHGTSGEIRVFPASTLFGKDYPWVLFCEIVETSRVYGRTAAAIRPGWIEEIFKNQCGYTYHDPWFDEESGTVKAREEVTFKGLCLIKNRIVELDRKNREMAQEIFIRDALLREQAGDRYRFISNNREIINSIRSAESKLRMSLYKGDWALENFYHEHLSGVTGVKELNSLIRNRGGESFLMVKMSELLHSPVPDSILDYRDKISILGNQVPVYYNFKPGNDIDGVSVIVTEEVFRSVPVYYWEWLPHVFIKERVKILTDNMAAQYQGKLTDPKLFSERLLSSLSMASGPFSEALSTFTYHLCGITLSYDEILKLIPFHLWLNIIVKDDRGFVKYQLRPPLSRLENDKEDWRASFLKADQEFTEDWGRYSFLTPVKIDVSRELIPFAGFPALFRDHDKDSGTYFLFISAGTDIS